MRVKFVEVDGVTTRYVHEGNGPPLMLLHGIGMSGDCFIRNVHALAEKFAVYAPDLPGQGFTDGIAFNGAAPAVLMARHVVRLADVLGLETYSLLGSSFGALVAALTYFEQQTRVNALVLVGSGSTFHTAQEQRKTLEGAAQNAEQSLADPSLDSLRTRLINVVYDPKSVAEEILPAQLTAVAMAGRPEAFRAIIKTSIEMLDDPESRVFFRLEKISVPTLVIVGRDDVRANWKMHVEGVKRMPNAALLTYEKCGHLPFMEHPERFNIDVRQFLSRFS